MKKIMFNDRFGLTDAVLEGRKTVTRRIVNIKDCSESHKHYNGADWKDEPMQLIINKDKDGSGCYCYLCGNGVSPKNKYCGIPLPYQVSEVVTIAQRYEDIISGARFDNWEIKELQLSAGYTNKMFVKAELMPNKIEILNVRAERLQDITDEDCIKEGIMETRYKSASGEWNKYYWHFGVTKDNCPHGQYKEYKTPREAFASLIDKVGKKGTWERNPYVFRYEFKKLK
ncbi:hypothetical protein [Dysgonomonas sp. 37-18]|uniref:hypothetical protein n=1 Tax=Dysgonomonas sp. 37-18 TaxID=1895907 RepID=UPI000926DA98|nr:hypothetical protein [Dysgonomonas sp. 37-18]OJX63077.1 MAG: hypothetical protein BGO84_14330 [Dysgonomonas sp. 37-18]